jgi:hypothetical protein
MNATRRVISTDTANSPSVAFTAALLRLAANIVADSKDMDSHQWSRFDR